jgi:hypothetical protein
LAPLGFGGSNALKVAAVALRLEGLLALGFSLPMRESFDEESGSISYGSLYKL